jgi:hypothetical protein
MADDVADQVVPVHALGELRLDVVTLPSLDTLQVGVGRRIDTGAD